MQLVGLSAADLDRHGVTSALGLRWRRLGYRADVERIVKASDLFVLPSYREGLPRSLVEAMACGLPAIASDIPACRELVDVGQTGVLVPARDPAALATAIRALAADPAARERMGAAARTRAEQQHDERVVVAKQIETYRRLL